MSDRRNLYRIAHIAAGEGAKTVLGSAGYEDSVTFVNGFRFIDDLLGNG